MGDVQPESVERLLRWERAGGSWRVLTSATEGGVTVVLDTCHGEEMERFASTDPALIDWLAGRTSSV